MTYFAKGKKMYRYPSVKTMRRLKNMGYRQMVWKNGDFICLQLN